MQSRPIRSPAELLEVLGIVKSGLEEGELRESPAPPRASNDTEVTATPSFLDLPIAGPMCSGCASNVPSVPSASRFRARRTTGPVAGGHLMPDRRMDLTGPNDVPRPHATPELSL
jgi:hypothetical protein